MYTFLKEKWIYSGGFIFLISHVVLYYFEKKNIIDLFKNFGFENYLHF